MNWLAIALIVLGLYFAFKVAGVVLRLAFVIVVLLAIYWLVAPHLGLPWPF